MLIESDYYSDDRVLDTASGFLLSSLLGEERADYYDVKDWSFTEGIVTFSNKASPKLYYRFFGDFAFPEQGVTWDTITGSVDYFLELDYEYFEKYYDRVVFADIAEQDIQTLLFAQWSDLLVGDDELRGGDHDDVLAGYKGDDILIGGKGQDLLLGGEGKDYAIFSGLLRDYDIIANPKIQSPFENEKGTLLEGWVVADTVQNRDGEDLVVGIERFYFSDLVLAFDVEGVPANAYSLYEAAFGRTPDESGLGFWIAQLEEGMLFEEVSARFIDSPEFVSLYGENPTDGEFLTALYFNILDRDPDPGGMEWWLNEIENNSARTRAKVLAEFALSEENQANIAGDISSGVVYESWFA